MEESKRKDFIKEIEEGFTEKEKAYYLNQISRFIEEEFIFNLSNWIKNVDERLDKYPESRNILLFEKYSLCKLYSSSEKLTIEAHKLFTQS